MSDDDLRRRVILREAGRKASDDRYAAVNRELVSIDKRLEQSHDLQLERREEQREFNATLLRRMDDQDELLGECREFIVAERVKDEVEEKTETRTLRLKDEQKAKREFWLKLGGFILAVGTAIGGLWKLIGELFKTKAP